MIFNYLLLVVLFSTFYVNSFSQNEVLNTISQKTVDSLLNQPPEALAKNATKEELSILFQNDTELCYAVRQIQYENAKVSNDSEAEGFSLYNMAVLETRMGKVKEAQLHLYKGLEIAEQIGLFYLKTKCLHSLGNIYVLENKFFDAIKNYRASLNSAVDIKEAYQRYEMQGTAKNMIGRIYSTVGLTEEAEKYFSEGKALFEKSGNKNGISFSYGGLSILYRNQGLYEKALKYEKKRLKLIPNNAELMQSNIMEAIASIYSDMNNYKRARTYFHKSLKIYQKLKEKYGEAFCLLKLSKLNLVQNVNPDTIIVYSHRALKIGEEIGHAVIIKDAAQYLWEIHKQRGESARALEMFELYQEKDVLTKEQHNSVGIKTEALRLKLAKQEREFYQKTNRDLTREKAKHTFLTYFFIISIVVFLGFIIVLGVKMRVYKKKRQELMNKLQHKQTDTGYPGLKLGLIKTKKSLDKELIIEYTDGKINETDWRILKELDINPEITNREIAKTIHMSYDAVLSSLKKMYKLFEIDVKRNHKIELLIKVTEISRHSAAS